MRRRAKAARPRKSKPKRPARPKSASNADDAPTSGRDPATGEFQAANRFWQARRSSAGPAPVFADGEALWKACDEYFSWAEDNPILEKHLVIYKGMTRFVTVPKTRPMTKRGLCRFLGIARTTWAEWKKDRPELAAAIERAESVIWDQKFAGALVGTFNGNLVARELGIAERLAGHDGGPVQVQDLTPRAADNDRLMVLLAPFLGLSPAEAARQAKALSPPKGNGGPDG